MHKKIDAMISQLHEMKASLPKEKEGKIEDASEPKNAEVIEASGEMPPPVVAHGDHSGKGMMSSADKQAKKKFAIMSMKKKFGMA